MKAFKCDRCGALFAIKPTPVEPAVTLLLACGASNHTDLCESCLRDFELWWKLPSLAAITNDEKL